MASPWSDVLARLRAVVEACAPRLSRAAVAARKEDFFSVIAAVEGLGATGQGALPAARPQELRELAELLPRFGERLAKAKSFSEDPLLAMLAAAAFGPAALLLARLAEPPNELVLSEAQARAFFNGLTGIMRGSEGSLAGVGAAAGSRTAQEEQARGASALYFLAIAVEKAGLATIQPGSPYQQAFLQTVTPELLLGWLQAAAQAGQCSEQQGEGRAGTSYAAARRTLASLLGSLRLHFQEHSRALDGQPELAATLFSLVLPVVHEAAVVLQLPPDRQPGYCSWREAGMAAIFLSTSGHQQSCQRALGMMDGSSGSSDQTSGEASPAVPRPLLRWLQSAAQLVQHVPCRTDADGTHSDYVNGLVYQLGQASALVAECCEQQPTAMHRQQQSQLAQLLLSALPKLHSLLRLNAGQPPSRNSTGVAISYVLRLLRLLTRSSLLSRPEDLPAWCRAVTSALRMLLLAEDAAAADRAGLGEQSSAAATAAAAAAEWLADSAIQLASSVAASFDSAECRAWMSASETSSGSLHDAMQALWQLHSTGLRAVHFAQLGDSERRLIFGSDQRADALLRLLPQSLGLGAALARQAPAEAGRALQAMAAAQVAALPPLAAALSGKPWASEPLLSTAVDLAGFLTPELAVCPQLLETLTLLASSLPEDPEIRGDFLLSLHRLLSAPLAMPFPALRLASGLVDCLLSEFGLLRAAHAQAQADLEEEEEGEPQSTAVAFLIAAVEGAAVEEDSRAEHSSADAGSQADAALLAALQEQLAALQAACQASSFPGSGWEEQVTALQHLMPAARRLAAALLDWRRRPEAAAAASLELARAAAARSCAYLHCANLRLEGGPAAGERQGSLRCGQCKAVWYCDTTCSHADWRGPAGHRKTCAALGQARLAERRQGRAEAGQADGAERA